MWCGVVLWLCTTVWRWWCCVDKDSVKDGVVGDGGGVKFMVVANWEIVVNVAGGILLDAMVETIGF